MTEGIDLEGVSNLITALLGGGGVFGAALGGWKLWKRNKSANQDDLLVHLLEEHQRIQDILEQLKIDTGADRALILRASNGGGIPHLSGEIYSTVLWECTAGELERAKPVWSGRSVDHDYRQILANILQHGQITIKFEDLPEDSDLGLLYQAHGVRRSVAFKVASVKGYRWLYGVLNYKDEQHFEECSRKPDFGHHIATARSEMREILKHNLKLTA